MILDIDSIIDMDTKTDEFKSKDLEKEQVDKFKNITKGRPKVELDDKKNIKKELYYSKNEMKIIDRFCELEKFKNGKDELQTTKFLKYLVELGIDNLKDKYNEKMWKID